MSSFHPSARAGLALLSAVLCAIASPAQADPGDHLACFKVKTAESFDAATVDLEAALPGFDLTGCKVSKKATQYCVPVTKTVTNLEGGTPVVVDGDTQVRQRLCYKIRCETFSPQVADATDQFGTHTMEVGKAVTVCTPAVPGDGPTTTTTLPPCVDADGDTYGTDCPAGADCNDANGAVHPGATELCNGIDDDCDASLDESDPAAGGVCSTGIPGVCSAGTTVCSSGALSCVQNTPSGTELCNGVDDDCDGFLDESDPSVGAACSTGIPGVCSAGTISCSSAALVCAQDTPSGTESCNGLDDDCDGLQDESDPLLGGACTTGFSGSCAGTLTCSSAALQCVPSSTPPEVCNNVDDDCDFSVDEGLSRSCYTGPVGTNGVGLCHAGSQTCSAGSWGASCPGQVIPVPETCGDGFDNDCDGFADEGC